MNRSLLMTFVKYFKCWLIVIGAILTAVSAPVILGADQVDPLLSTINQQLMDGQIVVIYQMENDYNTTEQYADWAYYLNDFASERRASYQFHQSNRVVNDKLNRQKINTDGSYTLFIKEGEASYFYPDVILEPVVYLAVDQAYAGDIDNDSQGFLPDEIKFTLD